MDYWSSFKITIKTSKRLTFQQQKIHIRMELIVLVIELKGEILPGKFISTSESSTLFSIFFLKTQCQKLSSETIGSVLTSRITENRFDPGSRRLTSKCYQE